MHCLHFICERKFYPRTHVKITRQLKIERLKKGRKRIKMKAMTENITGTRVCTIRIEFNLRKNVQFYLFRTFQCERSKTHQKGSVDANRSVLFR